MIHFLARKQGDLVKAARFARKAAALDPEDEAYRSAAEQAEHALGSRAGPGDVSGERGERKETVD
jgi:hypothetical protein